MSRIRIYSLSKLVGLPTKTLLKHLRLWGYNVHRPSSYVAAGELDRIRLWLAEPATQPPPPSPSRVANRTIYVDGSNICFVGKQARLDVLKAIRAALKLEGADLRRIHIICDATLRHRLAEASDADAREFEKGLGTLWHQVPTGTSADQQILVRLKAEPTSLVVSNDAFKKERAAGAAPPDLDERRISAFVVDTTLSLDFPRTWNVVPSGVVPLR